MHFKIAVFLRIALNENEVRDIACQGELRDVLRRLWWKSGPGFGKKDDVRRELDKVFVPSWMQVNRSYMTIPQRIEKQFAFCEHIVKLGIGA